MAVSFQRARGGLSFIALVLALNPGQGYGNLFWFDQENSSSSSGKATVKAPTPPPVFQDIAEQAGLSVAHISSPEKKYIVESMSGGTGVFDCDNDGKPDIVVVVGSTIERFRQGGDPMVTLYHQGPDG